MAGLNHEQLQQDLARTMGRGLVRSGVKVLLDSNVLGGEQVTVCSQCQGEAALTAGMKLSRDEIRNRVLAVFERAGAGVCMAVSDFQRKHVDLAREEERDVYAVLRGMKSNGEVITHVQPDSSVTWELVPGVADDHDDAESMARYANVDGDKTIGQLMYESQVGATGDPGKRYDWVDLSPDLKELWEKGTQAFLDSLPHEKLAQTRLSEVRAVITAETGAAIRDDKPLHEQVSAAIRFARRVGEDSWQAKYFEEDRLRKQAERTLGHVGTLIGIDADTKDMPNAVLNALSSAETRGRAKLVAEMNKLVNTEKEEEPDVRFDQ